jgi:serine/threonine-protein kinase
MAAPKQLGKYELGGMLGRGAMSIVYEAKDLKLQRRVAIKTVEIRDADDPQTQEQLVRFRQEAQAVAGLNHPNIVQVYDNGETDELAYIVMEYIEGPTLRSLMDRPRRFSLPDILRIMRDLLEALQFSHDRHIVHRDIKPANLMLSSTDLQHSRIKVADFGIARIESSDVTQAGTLLGTPAYMSPEQFRGEAVDARTDIYSAGVLLYQLLTGKLPFEGGMPAIFNLVLSSDPPAPSSLAPEWPATLDRVVKKAMAKAPSDRFASAAAFEAALVEAASAKSREPAKGAAWLALPVRLAQAVLSKESKAGARSKTAAAVALVAAAGVGVYVLMLKVTEVHQAPRPHVETPVPAPRLEEQKPPATTPEPPPALASPAVAQPEPVTPVPAPAPAPAPLPIAEAPPPPDPEAVGDVFAGLPGSQDCAALSGDVRDKVITVTGIAGPEARDGIIRKAGSRGLSGALRWMAADAEAAFCPVLDLLRRGTPRFGEADPGLSLHLADNRTFLLDGEWIRPQVTMPDFPGYLRLDYIGHDGAVQHLYPQAAEGKEIHADVQRLLAAGGQMNLGDPRPGTMAPQAAEPFGQDMIIAIVSSERLFRVARPSNAEALGPYLRDLNVAMQALRARGGRLAAKGMTVDIQPR